MKMKAGPAVVWAPCQVPVMGTGDQAPVGWQAWSGLSGSTPLQPRGAQAETVAVKPRVWSMWPRLWDIGGGGRLQLEGEGTKLLGLVDDAGELGFRVGVAEVGEGGLAAPDAGADEGDFAPGVKGLVRGCDCGPVGGEAVDRIGVTRAAELAAGLLGAGGAG